MAEHVFLDRSFFENFDQAQFCMGEGYVHAQTILELWRQVAERFVRKLNQYDQKGKEQHRLSNLSIRVREEAEVRNIRIIDARETFISYINPGPKECCEAPALDPQ